MKKLMACMAALALAAGADAVPLTVDFSKEADGRGHLLVSAFKWYGGVEAVVKGGLRPVKIRALDDMHALDEIPGWTWNAEKGLLTIPRVMSESACWLVDFEK